MKAQGRDALGLLRQIRNVILWQRIGEKPYELLTLEGTTVARSALAAAINGRVLDGQKKPVPSAAFTAFFEEQEYHFAETVVTGIDIFPQPLTAIDKPQREVFISYAWGMRLRRVRSAIRSSSVSVQLSKETVFNPSETTTISVQAI